MEKTLKKIKDRIEWCANLYGAKWRDELAILEPCRDALEEHLYYEEHTEDVPEDDRLVLIQYGGMTEAGGCFERDTGIGWYVEGDGWYVVGGGLLSFTVHKWRYLPEWKEEE